MATEPRRGGSPRDRWWVGCVALAGVWCAHAWTPVAVAKEPPKELPADVTNEASKRAVAYIHAGTPVTREELGEFLIARGGMEKLDLLVNKRVIEIEAARRGVSVTTLEVSSGLNEDLRSTNVSKEEFVRVLQMRYGKTLYEWEQDVIRPRLLISKMAHGRVKVTEADLQRAFESKYGEKREAQIVVWPKGPKAPELSQAVKDTARSKDTEFEKLAAGQPDKRFAEVKGNIAPIGRHIDGEDPAVEQALFKLKPGEISPWIETNESSTCIRCLKVIPPDPNITLDKVRAEIEKEVFDKKLNEEVPKVFAEIRRVANPARTVHAPEGPPPAPGQAPAPRLQHPNPKVLAMIYDRIPITREDLGEFLIARGGYEKIELLVNRRIIDMEAAKRGVTVTPQEIEDSLADDLKGLGVQKEDFIKVVLPKYGKTFFEWTEDVIKPRVVLSKMCRDQVKVSDDDLKKAFENRYGEKREAKVILWSKEDFRLAQKQWDEARKGDADFDRIARMMRDPNLAAACGKVAAIGRHTDAENPLIERVVFSLEVGEVSQLFQTPAGIMCVKCVGKIPQVSGVTLEAVRANLEKEVYEKKLARQIPELFNELKKQANPDILVRGAPTPQENAEGVKHLLQLINHTTPATAQKK